MSSHNFNIHTYFPLDTLKLHHILALNALVILCLCWKDPVKFKMVIHVQGQKLKLKLYFLIALGCSDIPICVYLCP